jgi:hypothetical protein
MQQNSNLFLCIGKQIKDEYGRVIGKVASFALTPSGKFDAVFIEQGDGRFLKRSVEYMKFDGTDATLISRIKSETNGFCDQIPLLWRKDQALKSLSEKKKISEELYQELHKNFDGALTQLKNEAQTFKEDLDVDVARCAEEIRELNYALVNLEIEHEIGKIDDQYYETAFAMIQENLKCVNMEKSDLEATKNRLSNILLGESLHVAEQEKITSKSGSQKGLAPVPPSPDLPEPPVVVYVKEIGKAAI